MKAIIVTDLGLGDCGKGTVIDYLAEKERSSLVVKHSGGAQCAHNVIRDGVHHTFRSFGSATLLGARTYLASTFLVNPLCILREEKELVEKGVEAPLKLMSVHPDAPVTTPADIAANRLRENHRNGERHGSCGMGIGETMKNVHSERKHMTVSDLNWNRYIIFKILKHERDQKVKELQRDGIPIEGEPVRFLSDDHLMEYAHACEEFAFYCPSRNIEWDWDVTLFEGSQGVLLDQDWGFFPHVTYGKTTATNALAMLAGVEDVEVHKLGVMRSYQTRHGAGPLPTEGMLQGYADVTEPHNAEGEYNGAWRTGALDMLMTRYAVQCNDGVDSLAITHMDRVTDRWPVATSYRFYDCDSRWLDITKSPMPHLGYQNWLTERLKWAHPNYDPLMNAYDFVTMVQDNLGAPVLIESYGPEASDKEVRYGAHAHA